MADEIAYVWGLPMDCKHLCGVWGTAALCCVCHSGGLTWVEYRTFLSADGFWAGLIARTSRPAVGLAPCPVCEYWRRPE